MEKRKKVETMRDSRNFRRLCRRAWEELGATCRIARVTCVWDAGVTLLAKVLIQIMNRTGCRETEARRKLLKAKHRVMLRYLQRILPDTAMPEAAEGRAADVIWLCWWQGEQAMPPVVRACTESVKRHAANRRVILITEENYPQYADIPRWLTEKYRAGEISPTHFSDILRLHLLAEHGGIWLDASVYCAGTPEGWDLPLWTIRRPGYGHISPAAGEFATYGMGCGEDKRFVFGLLRAMLESYWAVEKKLTDYLVLDYLMVLAQKQHPALASAFGNVPAGEPDCDQLCSVLGQPFDESLWQQLRKNTCLFKLTWKRQFPREKEGKATFYGMLLEGELG